MKVLGVWDSHDSGAALVADSEIRFVVNEERLSRRKLEVEFPHRSIRTILENEHLAPENIDAVAVSTSDFSKTLHRIFPSMKEEYYLIRRRKKIPSRFNQFKKLSKYWLTEIGSNSLTRFFSGWAIKKKLAVLGFSGIPIYFVDHHLCHAAAAAFTSNFSRCLVVTLDGLGDGFSASVSVLRDSKLRSVSTISAKTSFGIFFEHITNLMNMRELEDEGKVMALANYAYPIPDHENPLVKFYEIKNLEVRSHYSSLRMYNELAKVLYQFPSEQFAFMAQRALEVWVVNLVENALKATGEHNVALAGGVTSNIKVNRLIKNLGQVNDCFVFPHMGDGGLALGAALWHVHKSSGEIAFPLKTIQLGSSYSSDDIESLLRQEGLNFSKPADLISKTANIIEQGGIVLWFQGRSEMGPRSLGGRSILARPDSLAVKDVLNLKLKKRVWYQPFCPSILAEDAQAAIEDLKGTPNRFMTMGYMVRPEFREKLAGVINIDGSCRPQIVNDEPKLYALLLHEVKKRIGIGAVLNTSFNLHGEPMVNSPEDAVRTFKIMRPDAMVIHNFLVEGLFD